MPKPTRKPTDLNEVVTSTTALYKGSHDIVETLALDLPEIEADRDQLSQVVLNLLENARDAIKVRGDADGGGRIAIETRVTEAGAAVQLVLDDNGPGFSAEVRGKLFTPYFTTKHAAGGTGLGLAIVHRIVSDHDGKITVGDAPSGGARVTIELPVEPREP
jgi:signal transduction histidine kinase